ncbi:MAG TPA: CPBP family intramembrane metalloprotease [Papillibacter sp.]|jgi:membrane protease YdiL (CAAX protease family)|nr:CPBP family intramembrane metalloprotease [Papillibacter sp.]
MKRILAPVGRILAVMAIYYAAQLVVGFAAGFAHVFLSGMRGADMNRVMQELFGYLADKTPLIILVSAIVALASYFIIYRDRTQDVRAFLRFRPLDVGAIIMLVVFGIGINFMIGLFLALLKEISVFDSLFESYDALADAVFGDNFVVTLLSVGIIGPIVEEIMFRGLVFGELRKIMPIKIALVVQAVLFGVYHLQPVQGAYAIVIGLLIGFIYYRSGSLVAPIVVHIAVNSFSVVANALFSDMAHEKGGGLIVQTGILLFLLSGAYILVSRNFKYAIDDTLYHLSRNQPSPPEHTTQS